MSYTRVMVTECAEQAAEALAEIADELEYLRRTVPNLAAHAMPPKAEAIEEPRDSISRVFDVSMYTSMAGVLGYAGGSK